MYQIRFWKLSPDTLPDALSPWPSAHCLAFARALAPCSSLALPLPGMAAGIASSGCWLCMAHAPAWRTLLARWPTAFGWRAKLFQNLAFCLVVCQTEGHYSRRSARSRPKVTVAAAIFHILFFQAFRHARLFV